MFRVVTGSCLSLLAAVGLAGSAAAGDASTTRIVPHTSYGATVTIEAGVRVFRPLPRTTRVIINPNNTPLNLTFEETRNINEAPEQSSNGNDRAAANDNSENAKPSR